jgi:hypothetical protein
MHRRRLVTIGRLTMLAAELGTALACAPGIASADLGDATAGVVDATPAADFLVGAAGTTSDVTAFDPNNFAVSIDGMTLFQDGSATATSSLGGIAIADGAGSSATTNGFGDIATAEGFHSTAITANSVQLVSAVGDYSDAEAKFGGFDSAFANGFGAIAWAGGWPTDQIGYGDVSFANGDFSVAEAGNTPGIAGQGDFASATGIAVEAFAQNGPIDVVIEPSAATAGTDLWSELLTLF